MKLLICTQVIDRNDTVLGFFHRWVEEFAKHCEQVTVVCLREGEHSLPKNVRVFSLGKEKLWERTDLGEEWNDGKRSVLEEQLHRFRYALHFWKIIWQERKQYDSVFVHMNPEYLVLGGVFWRLWHKKVSLWYTHKSVDLKLRIATFFSNVIFTASKESFRLKSNKVLVMGHGIDTNFFHPPEHPRRSGVLILGRIDPVKRVCEMVFMAKVATRQYPFDITVVGDSNSLVYANRVEEELSVFPYHVTRVSGVTNMQAKEYFCMADVVLNCTEDGSFDKVVFEAAASGALVLTTNLGFATDLPPECLTTLSCSADALVALLTLSHERKEDLRVVLRERIENMHSLPTLIKKLMHYIV